MMLATQWPVRVQYGTKRTTVLQMLNRRSRGDSAAHILIIGELILGAPSLVIDVSLHLDAIIIALLIMQCNLLNVLRGEEEERVA